MVTSQSCKLITYKVFEHNVSLQDIIVSLEGTVIVYVVP